LNHEFTRISAVRELADGRVLVADAADRRLYVADLARGTVRRVGREGSGPSEYASLGALLPHAGDSTLLVDAMGSRYLLLLGDSIVETVTSGSPAHLAGARQPFGADASGFVIATRAMGSPPSASPGAMPPRLDSVYLMRVHRSSGNADTIATMMARTSRISVIGPREAPTGMSVTSNPLAAGDAAAMSLDGRVAIARQYPYRVDWIRPGGALIMGPPIENARRRLTTADKAAAMARLAASRGREPDDPDSRDDWPEFLPAFLPGALIAAADDRVWIARTPEPEGRLVLDVVDRSGRRVGRVSVGGNERILAVSRSAVYVVQTDDDGIQWLRRHPLPS
jgi:hypothetical protein